MTKPLGTETSEFDDRIDTSTELTLNETLKLLLRSVKLLASVRALFLCKFTLATISLFPALMVPWLLKIVVDQVILQRPFATETVPFPPFMMPLVSSLEGMSPNTIMITVVIFSFLMMVVFGLRAPAAEQAEIIGAPQGFDAATQSEQALSAGGSSANGIWGLIELLLTIRMTQRLANNLRSTLMGRLSRLEMTTLDDQRIGDSIYRVMYDAPMLPEICYRLTLRPVLIIIGAILSIYVLTFSYGEIAPELIWLSAAIMPAILLITAPLSGIARRVNQRSRAAGSATTNSVEESIDNIKAVQSLGGTEADTRIFDEKSSESFKRHRHTVLLDGAVKILTALCTTGALAYAFILITDEVIAGILSPGDYAVLFGVFVGLNSSAQVIGLYWIELQKNVAAVRRVFFFIDHTSELDRETISMGPLTNKVSLKDVNFSYPDGRQALQAVNLELSIGETVAIVGPTGAGKTTLAYMLPAYIRPTAGTIRFDGQDIAELHVDDIRDEVTFVFQEHMLLSISIKDNLLLANPLATDENIVEACRIAGALDFIEDLEYGMQTVIGKAGDTLSVGQKQRLSIARGLVRDTSIIVLDEPTASLDPRTETNLMHNLRKALHGKLIVLIAHRLSTIKQADRIIFLDKGRVLDIGNHQELMSQPNTRYHQFVKLQEG